MTGELSVVCPECAAAIGASCITLGRRVPREPHVSRTKAALKYLRTEREKAAFLTQTQLLLDTPGARR